MKGLTFAAAILILSGCAGVGGLAPREPSR